MRLICLVCAGAGLLAGACGAPPETGPAGSGAGVQAGAPPPGAGSGPDVEALGGPGAASAASVGDFVANIGDRVLFGFDRYDLSDEARATVQRQVLWLKDNPSVSVTLEGHADERGTREYNLALGERRASSVRDYMIALGIAPGRVATISYGKERPVDFSSSEESWARNRRAVTVITGGAG